MREAARCGAANRWALPQPFKPAHGLVRCVSAAEKLLLRTEEQLGRPVPPGKNLVC